LTAQSVIFWIQEKKKNQGASTLIYMGNNQGSPAGKRNTTEEKICN